MELHSINYCFSARINISNITTTLFYILIKVNKYTASANDS